MSCLEFLACIDAVSANSDSTSLCCHNHWDLFISFLFFIPFPLTSTTKDWQLPWPVSPTRSQHVFSPLPHTCFCVCHRSKLRVEDLREAQLLTREFQWVSDEAATHCKQCSKEFSISRRKVCPAWRLGGEG